MYSSKFLNSFLKNDLYSELLVYFFQSTETKRVKWPQSETNRLTRNDSFSAQKNRKNVPVIRLYLSPIFSRYLPTKQSITLNMLSKFQVRNVAS